MIRSQRRPPSLLLLPILLLAIILLGACASTQRVYLVPNQFLPIEPNGGRAPVAVALAAESVPEVIGHSTITVFAIESGDVILQEGPEKIMEALSEALRAADYQPMTAVERPEGPFLRCKVTRIDFRNYTWFMPMTLIWGDVGLSLSLVDTSGQTLWERQYTSGFDGRGTNQPFNRAVNIAFGKIMTRVAEDFTAAEFHEACCAAPLPRVSDGASN